MTITITRRQALRGTMALALGAAARPALSAGSAWPSRPIRLLVGGGAGSVPDTLARLAGAALSRRVGQPIVIENRPGAGGIAAMAELAGSRPDGHTIGLATISQAVLNSYLFRTLSYDPRRDLAPISLLATSSFILASHPSLGQTTLAGVVALSRTEAGRLFIAVPANGSPPHVAAILLMRETGLGATVAHFKTGPEALTAAMRGDVHLFVDGPTLIAPQVERGALMAVAATGARRSDALPGVPTVAEAGFAKAQFESWQGLVAPYDTPTEIVDRLAAECRAILDGVEYGGRLVSLGFVPRSATPQEFATLIGLEHERWSNVLRSSDVRAD